MDKENGRKTRHGFGDKRELTTEFDPIKDQRNRNKHGLSFTEAIPFLLDPTPDLDYDEEHSAQEVRYRGTFRKNDNYLFIVYTMRDEAVRLISARPATKSEITNYYNRE